MGLGKFLDVGLKAIAGDKAEDIKTGAKIAKGAFDTLAKPAAAPTPSPTKVDAPVPGNVQPKFPGAEIGAPTKSKDYYSLIEGLRAGTAKVKQQKEQREQQEALYGNFITTFQESEKFTPDYAPLTMASRDLLFTKPPEVEDSISLFRSLDITQSKEEMRQQATLQYDKLSEREKFPVIEKTIDNLLKEQQEHYDQWMAESRMSGGAGANKYWYNSPVRKYTATAGEEREEMLREALIDVPGSAVRGATGALTIGLPEVMGLKETPRKRAEFQENVQLQDTIGIARAISGAVGIVAGSFVTYGAIAGRIQSMFGKMAKLPGRVGKAGKVLSKNPTLSTYTMENVSSALVRNIAEEGLETAIRLSTGQEYGPADFLAGILMGGIFEMGLSKQAKNWSVDKKRWNEAEEALKDAEDLKGQKLTQDEMISTIMPLKANDQKTFQQLYDKGLKLTKNMAWKTGKEGAKPGLDTPAPLPPKPKAAVTKVSKVARDIEAKAIKKGVVAEIKNLAEYGAKTKEGEEVKIAKLLTEDFESARKMVRGTIPLEEGISNSLFIKAMEAKQKESGDVDLLLDLSRSPLVSETSRFAQEMRFLQERDPHSPLTAMKKAEEARGKAALRKALGDAEYASKFSLMEGKIKDLEGELRKLKRKEVAKIETEAKPYVEKAKKESLKKTPANKRDWESFSKTIVSQIICK